MLLKHIGLLCRLKELRGQLNMKSRREINIDKGKVMIQQYNIFCKLKMKERVKEKMHCFPLFFQVLFICFVSFCFVFSFNQKLFHYFSSTLFLSRSKNIPRTFHYFLLNMCNCVKALYICLRMIIDKRLKV